MQEVLNLTSSHLTIGALVAMPRVVELQPKTHRQMMKFVKQLGSDTSFNIGPIRFIKDLISYHMPKEVILDDQTNVPGLIETLIHDCGVTVILESAKQKKWFRYRPNQEPEVLKLSIH